MYGEMRNRSPGLQEAKLKSSPSFSEELLSALFRRLREGRLLGLRRAFHRLPPGRVVWGFADSFRDATC